MYKSLSNQFQWLQLNFGKPIGQNRRSFSKFGDISLDPDPNLRKIVDPQFPDPKNW